MAWTPAPKKKYRATLARGLHACSPPMSQQSPQPIITKKRKAPSAKKPRTKLDPAAKRLQRESIEKRILKLESRLDKDRTLLLRYAEDDPETAPAAATTTE